ncbi:hypothetical protein [Streptantibioticus silvisoli]|uniref:Uncharacterized protein n=1 Tax=Streptantibioticus silvisoli TaxID=2705255 RepID=A0ABT6W3G3_9ACTN|nr:hypothetical protein [Streptantibioticus silvisoli]MDI5964517.1 hypothetical protein [Streptantibioticus silvisoli]
MTGRGERSPVAGSGSGGGPAPRPPGTDPDRTADGTWSIIAGGFLLLHALLHVALAPTLSTADYLIAGRAVSLSTFGAALLCLFAYRRRAS